MKKLLSILILLGILFSHSTYAADKMIDCCKLRHQIEIDGVTVGKEEVVGATSVTGCTFAVDHNVDNWAAYCAIDSVMVVADIVNFVALVASGVIFMAAGFMYLVGAGSPERSALARKFLVGGFIGSAIVIFSRLIASFGRFLLGG